MTSVDLVKTFDDAVKTVEKLGFYYEVLENEKKVLRMRGAHDELAVDFEFDKDGKLEFLKCGKTLGIMVTILSFSPSDTVVLADEDQHSLVGTITLAKKESKNA